MFTEKIEIKVSINNNDTIISRVYINQDLRLQFIKDILEKIKGEIKTNE